MSLPTLLDDIQIGWPPRAPPGLTRLSVAATLGWLLLAQARRTAAVVGIGAGGVAAGDVER
jgi:hypothetical protein